MAPRRGGGGGNVGGGSGGSSCTSDYPCTTDLHFMYGYRFTSLYSDGEVIGQLVLFIIWSIVLIALLLLLSHKWKSAWRPLPISMGSFLASFILLCVRYGLIIGEKSVPIGYRYESSIVVLFQRLAMPFLFAAVHWELQPRALSKIVYWLGLAVYAALNVAYLVYDFIISSEALKQFKNDFEWHLSDRDFGLTYTPDMIGKLETSSLGGSLAPDYIELRMFDPAATDYLHDRDIQIKIGLAADALAVVLALVIVALMLVTWWRWRKNNLLSRTFWLFLAAAGLLLTTLFRLVIVVHYVFKNWKVVTDATAWAKWARLYVFVGSLLPDGFLEGYRPTVHGFPVVQAVFEPLGVVLACAAVVFIMRAENKKQRKVAA